VKTGSLKTRNNFIIGNYIVTDYLELLAADGPLIVNVTMNNANKGVPTRLSVGSINANLGANVSLYSNEATGGDFEIDASTSNTLLHVRLPIAPINHVLHFTARNSEAPAWVDLPPTYEGSYYLSSSIKRPHITVIEDLEDPKGGGRIRQVAHKNAGHEVGGDISWVGDDDFDGSKVKMGSVEVITNVHEARLSL
jgi:hypothetical protein